MCLGLLTRAASRTVLGLLGLGLWLCFLFVPRPSEGTTRPSEWNTRLLRLGGRSTSAIWQTDPTAAWSTRVLTLGAGEPTVRSDVRSVVVRRDRLRAGVGAELVAAWAVTDDDARAETASQYILTWAREPELQYRGRLRNPSTGASVAFAGVRYRWRYSHEVVFEVPDSFVWPTARSATVELEMSAELGDRAVASYDLVLRPIATPRSSLALCSKPIYAPPSPMLNGVLNECALDHSSLASDRTGREHHALLGVEVVHFSARDAGHAEHVAAMNRRSGRSDTFSHIPALDPTSPWGFHDEHITVNDCFARARAATEWLGVLDLDEYMALDASATWSASTVLRELRSLPANVTSAYLQVRRRRSSSR